MIATFFYLVPREIGLALDAIGLVALAAVLWRKHAAAAHRDLPAAADERELVGTRD